MDRRELRRAAFLRFTGGASVLGMIFFGSAGTLRYWEGWVFMAVLFLPVGLVALAWLVGFLIPGLDHRFGWSSVPTPLVLVADLLVLAGHLIFFLTLRENRFASRVIRVEEGQVVITSGPYALVRHPMYLGVVLMLLFAPLALGSWWAVIPSLATPVLLLLRIRDEEAALMEGLPGYRECPLVSPVELAPKRRGHPGLAATERGPHQDPACRMTHLATELAADNNNFLTGGAYGYKAAVLHQSTPPFPRTERPPALPEHIAPISSRS